MKCFLNHGHQCDIVWVRHARMEIQNCMCHKKAMSHQMNSDLESAACFLVQFIMKARDFEGPSQEQEKGLRGN